MEKTNNDEVKMEELIVVQQELYNAKDNAMQSWLDSKPLIDELEKLQSDLANAKNRVSMLNLVISELESQLDDVSNELVTKIDEEEKAKGNTDEMNKLLAEKYIELEKLKAEMEEERKVRLEVKQVLRVKRQTLQTYQLTLRAIKIEIEAFEISKKEESDLVRISGMENGVVRVEQGEFYQLKKRAKEEEALAEWRISVSLEQKLAAQEKRNFALSRLMETRKKKEEISESKNRIFIDKEVEQEEEGYFRVEENVRTSKNNTLKARAEATSRYRPRGAQKMKRRTETTRKNPKLSFFRRFRMFLVRRFRRIFR